MKLNLFFIVAATVFCGCSHTETAEHNNVPDNTFDLSIKAYKLSYAGKGCAALTDERSFYYLLEQTGSLKNEQDYFADRSKYKGSIIKIDSATYFKNTHQIVFPDSCNTSALEGWVKRFKEDDKNASASLRNDTILKARDQKCLFYKLLGEGLKIYQEDVSGYYNIKK
jgi:hypothetical protein